MEYVVLAVVAVAVALLIQAFLVKPYRIPSASMENTLLIGDRVLVDRISWRFSQPARGDIVVFKPPTDPGKYYVKRVIGLPGDTVIIRDGFLYVHDKTKGDIKLPEPYISAMNAGKTFRYPVNGGDTTEEIFNVPQDQYFLLGDNRQGSLDSRSFAHLGTHETAFVPRSNIKGSVWFVALPITKLHAFEAPQYGL